MNALQTFASEPWAERLAWTLVHFLWQGSLIALLYAAARRAAPRASPNARYLLAVVTLAIMSAAPLVTWVAVGQPDLKPDATYRFHTGLAAAFTASAPSSMPMSMRSIASQGRLEQFLPWIALVWFAGTLVFSLRLAGGWVVAIRMRSVLVRLGPPEWQERLTRLGARIGISRPVRLLVSAAAQAPTVVGWLRPVILIPVGALSGMPVEHLEAMLLHELAHIRRHDYLVNLLQSVAETLLFYHPAVWWISAQIRAEREFCCDDIAVSATGDALTFARALVQFESCRRAHFSAAVAANGGSLSSRVARLLGHPEAGASILPGAGTPLTIALVLVAGWLTISQGWAQPQNPEKSVAAVSEFEVVSIKQIDPERNGYPDLSFVGTSGKPFKISGNRVTISGTLHSLIAAAYGVKTYQIAAVPSWADNLRYVVNAKAPGDATLRQEEAQPMLQSLLADRFQLRLRHETKEMPVYHMTIGRKTDLFKPAGADEVFRWDLTPGPQKGLGRSKATKESMADFVQLVGVSADRPVINKTGLTGEIDYEILYSLEGVRNMDDLNQSILDAVKDQLGLKLEPARDSVELLVIEQAQKPSSD